MRIALFGSGWIMDFHARGVLDHPGGELVAAANWREASLRSLAERHGIPRITTDWRELVADPGVDAVIIGTPNALHAPQAIACLEAGKHVLVEKPMARTLAEAEAMNAAAAASGRRLMVAHCWRFHDDVRALLRTTPSAARAASDLIRSIGTPLGVLVSNLTTTAQVTVANVDGVRQLLVQLPRAVYIGLTLTATQPAQKIPQIAIG